MTLPITAPYPPMEAKLVGALPRESGMLYEPKWDGFRCLCFREGDDVYLQAKSTRPLTPYFPEIVAAVLALPVAQLVIDGELVVEVDDALDFDQLLQRIHPAESRVRHLATTYPARLLVFDLLVDPAGERVADLPLSERRARLEALFEQFGPLERIALSPATTQRDDAEAWLAAPRQGTDGVMAKKLASPYRSGDRDAMFKVKRKRTADCVIGGYRLREDGRGIGSLLLGLYDGAGRLQYVGFTSSLNAQDRAHLLPRLQELESTSHFEGRAPGGPSRWNRGRSAEWVAVQPSIVLEVEFDHVSGGRFRHGTRALRFRPDKDPRQCSLDQLERR